MAHPKFRGENFCRWPTNHEICESFLPQKFSAIHVQYLFFPSEQPTLHVHHIGSYSTIPADMLWSKHTAVVMRT